MYHWHHNNVIDPTLEPSSAVYKSWVVGETYCSISTDWLISIYDLFPVPNISGFIAHFVTASHRYCKVNGSNPIEVLTLSGFYIRNYINCVHNCKDHSLLDFTSALQYMKYFIYNFTSAVRYVKYSIYNFTFIPHRNAFITVRIIAYLISHLQFKIWNISYITSHSFLTGSLGPTTSVAS